MICQKTITLATNGHGDLRDLTALVNDCLKQMAINIGTVNVFAIGSTVAIGTLEFEPGLQEDLPAVLDRLLPPSRDYGHERTWHDGNGHSHLQATLLGPSLTVPLRDGHLWLGTWQQIVLLECDIKPRQRQVVITATGE